MIEVKHFRLDDRLVHGQIVTAWVNDTHCDTIIVADEKAASDSLLSAALGSSATYDKIMKKDDTILLTDMQQRSWSEKQVQQAFSEIKDKLALPKGHKLTVSNTAVSLEKRLSR